MNKTVELEENSKILVGRDKIFCLIKERRGVRRMRLMIHNDGSIEMVVPKGTNEYIIKSFLQDKKDWLLKKINLFSQFKDLGISKLTRKDYLENKSRTLTLVVERIEYFNKFYNFEYNKICIKNQKTRWGSCSIKKNLNFNYKILFLPVELQDYIIVHELCHLEELNHSKRFWDKVSQTIPGHKILKKQLKMII